MIPPKTRALLDRFGAQTVKELKQKASKYSASGSMVKGFRHETTSTGLTIYGVNYLKWAETGRGPTGAGAKRGNPTLQQSILMWLTTKGIALWRDKKGRFIGRKTMAFLISRKIHREGSLLYRKKGFRDIYTSILTERRVRDLVRSVQGEFTFSTSSDLIQLFNKILNKQAA
jgi:hypothetical protein